MREFLISDSFRCLDIGKIKLGIFVLSFFVFAFQKSSASSKPVFTSNSYILIFVLLTPAIAEKNYRIRCNFWFFNFVCVLNFQSQQLTPFFIDLAWNIDMKSLAHLLFVGFPKWNVVIDLRCLRNDCRRMDDEMHEIELSLFFVAAFFQVHTRCEHECVSCRFFLSFVYFILLLLSFVTTSLVFSFIFHCRFSNRTKFSWFLFHFASLNHR